MIRGGKIRDAGVVATPGAISLGLKGPRNFVGVARTGLLVRLIGTAAF